MIFTGVPAGANLDTSTVPAIIVFVRDDSHQAILHQELKTDDGKFSFYAPQPGQYKICLFCRDDRFKALAKYVRHIVLLLFLVYNPMGLYDFFPMKIGNFQNCF